MKTLSRRETLAAAAALPTVLHAQPATPLIAFVSGEQEYSSETTLQLLAGELARKFGFRTLFRRTLPDQNRLDDLPGIEAIDQADLVVLYFRWLQLPEAQLQPLARLVESGRPVLGFRTTTHAFNYPKGHPLESWNAFGSRALGSPPGWGNGHTHYGHDSSTDVTILPDARRHPILSGVQPSFHVRSWLYHVVPNFPPKDAVQLLQGVSVKPDKPAVPNPVAWTWKRPSGGLSFCTTMGHPEDFGVEPFQRMVVNAVHWLLKMPVPKEWPGRLDINVPYRGFVK
jgi:type 1 glutamine amidotransferase